MLTREETARIRYRQASRTSAPPVLPYGAVLGAVNNRAETHADYQILSLLAASYSFTQAVPPPFHLNRAHAACLYSLETEPSERTPRESRFKCQGGVSRRYRSIAFAVVSLRLHSASDGFLIRTAGSREFCI